MAHLPPSLFTPMDSLAAVLCVAAALYCAIIAAYLVAVGAGYARRAYADHHTKP